MLRANFGNSALRIPLFKERLISHQHFLSYQHRFVDGVEAVLPLGKIVCVGRNYAAHAAELNNPVPQEPVLFIKPASSVIGIAEPICLPHGKGSCHFETELALLIGQEASHIDAGDALDRVAGYGLALDLTLRDLQDELKRAGLPWEKSKAFDGACVLAPFVRPAQVKEVQDLWLRLKQNGELRQDGHTAQMLTPVAELLAYISRWFRLLPGDVVLTGTPAGVGPLQAGDELELELSDLCRFEARVH